MIYNKQDIRRWVRDAIRQFFEGEKVESTGPDMKICFEEELIDIMRSKIKVVEKVEGEWVTRATFMPLTYFNGPWDMITVPWINDLVNDVVDAVIPIIQK